MSLSEFTSTCHCGMVSISLPSKPPYVKECNCSVCHRYGAVWAYYPIDEIKITVKDDSGAEITGGRTDKYVWGDGNIEFHRCRRCGNMTHWWPTSKMQGPLAVKMGANARMFPGGALEGVEWKVIHGP